MSLPAAVLQMRASTEPDCPPHPYLGGVSNSRNVRPRDALSDNGQMRRLALPVPPAMRIAFFVRAIISSGSQAIVQGSLLRRFISIDVRES